MEKLGMSTDSSDESPTPKEITGCATNGSDSDSHEGLIPCLFKEGTGRHGRCNICNVRFQDYTEAETHVHNLEATFMCTKCRKYFLVNSSTCAYAGADVCMECKLRKQLKLPFFTILPEDESGANVECSVCQSLHDVSAIAIHMWTHTKLEPFECRFCYRSYTHYCDFSKHVEETLNSRFQRRKWVKVVEPGNCSSRTSPVTKGITFEVSAEGSCISRRSPYEPCISDERVRQGFCVICNRSFTDYRDLEEHMMNHREELATTFMCTQCSRHFLRIFIARKTGPDLCIECLIGHSLGFSYFIFTSEDRMSCITCNSEYGRNDNIALHLWIHSELKPFTCVYCRRGYMEYCEFREHMEETLNSSNKRRKIEEPETSSDSSEERDNHHRPCVFFEGLINHGYCSICGEHFDYTEAEAHMSSHNLEDTFKCIRCDKHFLKTSSAHKHKYYLCKQCTINFTSDLPSFTPEDENGAMCNKCKRVYDGNAIANHLWTHALFKPFVCTFCSRSYMEYREFSEHVQKTLNSRNELRAMENPGTSADSSEESPTSNETTSEASGDSDFDSGKNWCPCEGVLVEGKMRGSCSVCSETFNDYKDLEEHMNQHDLEAAFMCTRCFRHCLSIHMTEVGDNTLCRECLGGCHLGLPYFSLLIDDENVRCHSCESTKHKSDIATHLWEHIGVKPFFCEFCGRSYMEYREFNEHMEESFKRSFFG